MNKYYHATSAENAESIMESGTLKASMDGCVHLTTNLDKALLFIKSRGHNCASVFTPDLHFLDESKIEPFYDGTASGDDCYIHVGDLNGVEHVEDYYFTPPDAE